MSGNIPVLMGYAPPEPEVFEGAEDPRSGPGAQCLKGCRSGAVWGAGSRARTVATARFKALLRWRMQPNRGHRTKREFTYVKNIHRLAEPCRDFAHHPCAQTWVRAVAMEVRAARLAGIRVANKETIQTRIAHAARAPGARM